jgi:hypothetical protein
MKWYILKMKNGNTYDINEKQYKNLIIETSKPREKQSGFLQLSDNTLIRIDFIAEVAEEDLSKYGKQK